jgi:hypothetical protein
VIPGKLIARLPLVLVWTSFLTLALPHLLLLFQHVPFEYNEGWNAYNATAALSGRPLYPSPESFFSNNYPPLSFYIVGVVGRLCGDLIIGGRLVAIAGFLVTLINLFRLSRWAGATRFGAALGAGLFALSSALILPTYIAMNDPQWLGHALVTSGALMILGDAGGGATRLDRLALGILLMGMGGLVKHNLIALPLAVLLWTALCDRRRLGLLIALGTGLGALFALLLWALWGKALFTDILLHERVMISVPQFWAKTSDALALIAPYAVFTAAAFALAPRDPRIRFIAIYAALALVSGPDRDSPRHGRAPGAPPTLAGAHAGGPFDRAALHDGGCDGGRHRAPGRLGSL